jgi:hypothetical protein
MFVSLPFTCARFYSVSKAGENFHGVSTGLLSHLAGRVLQGNICVVFERGAEGRDQISTVSAMLPSLLAFDHEAAWQACIGFGLSTSL